MPVFVVPEEVEDADFLHQAADEVQRRFPVLHAELELGIISARHRHLVVGEPESLEDLLDDLRDVEVLKDATVRAVAQIPKPGHQPRAILAQIAADHRRGLPLRNHRVDDAPLAILRADGKLHLVADHLLGGDRQIGRQHLDVVEKQLGNAFTTAQRRGEQTVLLVRAEGWPTLTLPTTFAAIGLGLLVYDHFQRLGTLALVLAAASSRRRDRARRSHLPRETAAPPEQPPGGAHRLADGAREPKALHAGDRGRPPRGRRPAPAGAGAVRPRRVQDLQRHVRAPLGRLAARPARGESPRPRSSRTRAAPTGWAATSSACSPPRRKSAPAR